MSPRFPIKGLPGGEGIGVVPLSVMMVASLIECGLQGGKRYALVRVCMWCVSWKKRKGKKEKGSQEEG